MVKIDEKRCCGCGLCVNICHNSARCLNEKGIISVSEKCDDCNICIRVCVIKAVTEGK